MVTVHCARIGFFRMALQADSTTGIPEFSAVRIVAIATRDAGCEHFALLERNIIVGLRDVANLPVGPIDISSQWSSDSVCLLEPLSRHPIL